MFPSIFLLISELISAICPLFKEMLNLHSWAMAIGFDLKINNTFNILMLMIYPPSQARKKAQALNLVAM